MSRRSKVIATAVTLAALAAPASALAAAPWSAPVPLKATAAQGLPGSPSITANAAGLAVAVSDVGGSGAIGPHAAGSVFTNGAFGDPFDLAAANVSFGPEAGGVAAYAQTRLLASGVKYAKNSSQAVFAFGRLTANHADLETPRALGPSNMHAGPTAIAVNAAGDAAMVYPVCRDAGCEKALVYLAVRKAGSSTISSTRLADGSGPLPRVAAAINSRGDALAVWTQASRVYARIRTAGGTVRDRQTVGAVVRGTHLAPSASLSTHRGELVGWVSQAVSEGDGGPGTTSVAQARDGSAFASLKLADLPAGTGRYVSGAGIRVAFDPFGRRLLTWTGFDNDKFTVHSAELHGAANSPTISLTDPTTVSDPAVDTILEDATTNGAGTQLLMLLAGARGNDAPSGTTTVQAALRAANTSGPFARESVSAGTDYAFDAHATLLPDRALAVWATVSGQAMWSQRVPSAG
ncbi:MAG TPA: hypothetical protein VH834_10565 [Solirubrobacteraceae bacterium]|jgi:hypothetical protein